MRRSVQDCSPLTIKALIFNVLFAALALTASPAHAGGTPPPTPTITAGGATTFCQGGTVVLTASATGATSYQWYINGNSISGATSPTYTATISGNYTATATNAGGTSAQSTPTSVTVNPNPPTPTITAGGNTSFCAGGSVVLTANASGASSYQWFLNGGAISGATSQTYTASAAGSYSVTVTNSAGCGSASSLATSVTVLPAPAAPGITASGPTTFCAPGSVILNAVASGASSYQWYLNGNSIAGATANTYTATASGNYTLVVTNAGGCSSPPSTPTSVTVNPSAATPTISASGPTTFCSGGNVALTANATNATSYKWFFNGSSISGATTNSYTASANGAYTVSIVDANGCVSALSSPTTVSINPTPATPTITAGGNTPLCQGQSVTLTANGSGALVYQWYLGGTQVAGATAATYNAGVTGNYTVTITDANGCTSAQSASTAVTIDPVPPAPNVSAGGPTTFCSGGSVNLTASASGAANYQWYYNGASISGATSNTYVANASGNYTVSYDNVNGCPSSNSTVTTVTVASPPPAPSINAGGPTAFCNPGSVVLTAQGAVGATSYQWYSGGVPISGATNQAFTATTSGSYTVTYTNGCSSVASPATAVNVYTPITGAAITAGGPTTFCQGLSVNLTTAAGNVASFQWNLNGSPIPGANTQIYSAGSAGSYTVTVTNPCSSPVTSAPVTVTVNPAPGAPTNTAAGPVSFCAPGSVGLSATPTGATAYQWFNDGSAITGATTANYTASATGDYTVSALNGLGCSSLPSNAIQVTAYPPLSAPPIVAAGSTTVCAGQSVTLTATEGGVTNYQWLLNGNPIPGATSPSYPATTTGTYSVSISNPCSSATSGGVNVTVDPNPSTPNLSAGSSTTFCQGSQVTLTASSAGATAFQWSNNDTVIASVNTQTFTTDSSGSYTVTVSNTFGCTATSSPVVVTVYPQLAPLNLSVTPGGPTTFCDGSNVVLTANATGATNYQWYFDGTAQPGATTATFTATLSGTYTVTISNPCSTVSSSATIVTVNPVPATPIVTATGNTNLCQGDSVILNANASGAVSYQWFMGGTPVTGETTNADTILVAGAYTVTVTNASGCSSAPSAAENVAVNPLPAAPTISAGGPTTFCSGNSVLLSASPTGGSAYQWYLGGAPLAGANGTSYSGSQSGNYTLTLTDGNGCVSPQSTSQSVTVNPVPASPGVSAGGPTSFCSGDSVILTMTATGAVSQQWLLNGTPITNATTTTDTALVSGAYTATITDVNGCTSAPSSSILVSADPTPSIPLVSAAGVTVFCWGDNVTLAADAPGASTYQWYRNDTVIAGATSSTYAADTTGLFMVTVGDANGCSSDTSAKMTVTANPVPDTPIVSASGPLGICPGSTLLLTANPGGLTSYQWYVDGTPIAGANAQTYTADSAGTYTVSATNTYSCTSALDTNTVITNPCLPKADMAIIKQVSPGPYNVQTPVTYTLTVTNNGPDTALNVVVVDTIPAALGDPTNYTGATWNLATRTLIWTFDSLVPGTTTLTFEAALKGFGTIPNTATVTNTLLDPDTSNNHSTAVLVFSGNLFIPNVITPNGDGKNDYFAIVGLSAYPNSGIKIYNRWGSEVYESQDYANNWNGSGLSAGTYYYILSVNMPTGRQTYKGWVEIIR